MLISNKMRKKAYLKTAYFTKRYCKHTGFAGIDQYFAWKIGILLKKHVMGFLPIITIKLVLLLLII